MIPKGIVKKVKKIEIRTRALVTDMLSGQYQSAFKGRGMSFEEVRKYQPGDDIRLIDWNVTARTNDPYIKLFREERELTMLLLVDASASFMFGSREMTKRDFAAELAAVLAFSAIRNNDRVGLVVFTDTIEKFVPPKKGRKHVLRVVSEILNFQPKGRNSDVRVPLEFVSRISKRRSIVFLVSDFIVPEYEKEMRIAARRHDLIPVVVEDPMERSIPPMGLVQFEDPETGDVITWDVTPAVARKFRKKAEKIRQMRSEMFRRLDLDFLELLVGEDYLPRLTQFFRNRGRRMIR